MGRYNGYGISAQAALSSLPAMLSIERVAEEMAVSKRTVQRLVQRFIDTDGRFGLGPVFYIGNRPRIATHSLAEYLEASRGA